MDTRCPVCWLNVVEDQWTCTGCGTRQHGACVRASGGCVVAGCTGRVDAPRAEPSPVEVAADPAAAATTGDPRRGFFGRMLDAVVETLAILPRAAPFLALAVFAPMAPQLLGLDLGRTAAIALYYACTWVPLGLLAPAVMLLVLDPATRGQGPVVLTRRAVATWRRLLPAALAVVALQWLVAQLVGLTISYHPNGAPDFDTVRRAITLTTVLTFAVAALFQHVPALACSPVAGPPLRGALRLARRHPGATLAALVPTVLVPMAAQFGIMAFLMQRGLIFNGDWSVSIGASLASELVSPVFQLVYLGLLYRDLTARPQTH